VARSPDLPAAKPKPPAPAPPPTTKQQTATLAGLGGSSTASAIPGYHVDASGNYVSDTTGQPLIDPTTNQPLSASATDPNTQAILDFFGQLGGTDTTAWNPNMRQPADPAAHQAALASWQHSLVSAGIIPANQPITYGLYDDATIKATGAVLQFAGGNNLDPNAAVGKLGEAYHSVASATSTADPALLAAERALRRAQLPLDWADLNRRIAEQPILDAELKRRIAEQPLLDADLARRLAVEKALPQTTATKLKTDARDKWWIPLGDSAALDWGTRISKGQATEEDFTLWAQGQAASLYPQVAKYITQGAQTSTVLDPYLQLAAKELDKNPATMVGDTRYFSPAFMDQNGALPDTNTYLQKLRTLPEWRTTTSANNLANDWSAKLAETFGGVAGISTGALTQP
jgi:hypothetical protein